jgi:hypothetical protein
MAKMRYRTLGPTRPTRHRYKRGNNNSGVRGRVICEFARDTSDNRGREQGTNGRSSHHRLICALV